MTDWIKLEETQKAQHRKALNEELARIGFKPGELQAAIRNGGNLAPFTTRELELGLLDAFANEGGATVWGGDGSSCAVQILNAERARAHAEGKAEGRRDDVLFLENEAHEYALKGLTEESRVIDRLATALRSLIPAAPLPTGPATPEKP